MDVIHELADRALDFGRLIDLSDVSYGLPHPHENKPEIRYPAPCDYYYFLAGFVKHTESRRIVEIGTWMGGSACAMERGFKQPFTGTELIVTIDKTNASDSVLQHHPLIKKIEGDACDANVMRRTLELTATQPVDILFIDGDHDYQSAMTQFSVYVALTRPRYVLLDDISLNESMRDLWSDICRLYGARARNLSEISAEYREPSSGIGLIDLRESPAEALLQPMTFPDC